MALPTIIAVNQSNLGVEIDDLGQLVGASGTKELTKYAHFYEVAGSPDLDALVVAGTLLINDGTSTLSKSQSLAFLDATGNLNGPASPTARKLLMLSDSSGRYTICSPISILADGSVDLGDSHTTTTGILSVGSVTILGAPLGLDHLSDVSAGNPVLNDTLVVGLGGWVTRKNMVGSTAPTPSNDSTEGYSVGSRWVATSSGSEYVCVSDSPGSAVWRDTTSSGTGGGGSDVHVKVSSSDLISGLLSDKLVTTTQGVVLGVQNPASNEALQLSLDSASTTGQGLVVLASAADVEAGIDSQKAVTPASLVDHDTRDTLAHNISENYESQVTRTGGRVSGVTIWSDGSHTKKIREYSITRSSGRVALVVTTQYDAGGSPSHTLTETISRSDSGRISGWVGVLS